MATVSRIPHPFISVVSPVYNAETILETLIDKVTRAITKITHEYEIILVDDGSRDQSWKTIKTICSKNTSVKVVKLSINCCKNNTISACLEHS
jgi:glycosyltransferase involved in cell wall biosynthesis